MSSICQLIGKTVITCISYLNTNRRDRGKQVIQSNYLICKTITYKLNTKKKYIQGQL